MIKDALNSLRIAARRLWQSKPAILLFALLYLLLLLACYLFVTTREATALQLAVTTLAALAAPLLLFLLIALAINYTRADASSARLLLSRALRDVPKLILASLPLLLLGVGLAYLLTKLQAQIPAPAEVAPVRTYPVEVTPPAPLRTSLVLLSALRLLIFGVLLPLALTHTLIAVARTGFALTLRNYLQVLHRAFSARSITIYTLGLLLFGVLPYFLIFTRTPVASAWSELLIFGLRLLLVSVLALGGWVITTGALAASDYDTTPADTPDASAHAAATLPPSSAEAANASA